MLGFVSAALFIVADMLTGQKVLAVSFLTLAYGGFTACHPAIMGLFLDIGWNYAGAVTGAMNTATYVADFLSSVAYGYIVNSYGYDAPFIPMIALLVVSAVLWFRIDATKAVASKGLREARQSA